MSPERKALAEVSLEVSRTILGLEAAASNYLEHGTDAPELVEAERLRQRAMGMRFVLGRIEERLAGMPV